MAKMPQTRLAHWVHSLLQWGMGATSLLLLTGLFLVFVKREPRPSGMPAAGFELLRHAVHGDGMAILQLGLVVLMLTPMLRVALLATGWALERDWLFAAVALGVLMMLAIGLGLGLS